MVTAMMMLALMAGGEQGPAVPARASGCRTEACRTRVRKRRAEQLRARRRRAWCDRYVWRCRWARLPEGERAWARRVSWCESRGNPRAHDAAGLHHGGFQYLLSTARAAGFSGDPHLASWHEQAVRSVWWARKAGRSQWQCK